MQETKFIGGDGKGNDLKFIGGDKYGESKKFIGGDKYGDSLTHIGGDKYQDNLTKMPRDPLYGRPHEWWFDRLAAVHGWAKLDYLKKTYPMIFNSELEFDSLTSEQMQAISTIRGQAFENELPMEELPPDPTTLVDFYEDGNNTLYGDIQEIEHELYEAGEIDLEDMVMAYDPNGLKLMRIWDRLVNDPANLTVYDDGTEHVDLTECKEWLEAKKKYGSHPKFLNSEEEIRRERARKNAARAKQKQTQLKSRYRGNAGFSDAESGLDRILAYTDRKTDWDEYHRLMKKFKRLCGHSKDKSKFVSDILRCFKDTLPITEEQEAEVKRQINCAVNLKKFREAHAKGLLPDSDFVKSILKRDNITVSQKDVVKKILKEIKT